MLPKAVHVQEEVDERLQVQHVKGRYRQLVNPTAEEELAQTLRMAGGGTLIIGAGHPAGG